MIKNTENTENQCTSLIYTILIIIVEISECIPRSYKMFWCLLPPNFGQKVPPKARKCDKADFATKVRKFSKNGVNVNHEQ